MTDLDLAALRTESARAVVAAKREGHGVTPGHFASFKPEVVLALLDRIDYLETDRARLIRDLEETEEGVASLVVERDDETARADRAEARLVRVKALHTAVVVYEIDPVNGTWVYEGDERKVIGHLCQECTDDDTLADLEDEGWQDDGRSVWHPCATIRAVAADEQEREKCLHCRRPMDSEDGRYWIHAEGVYRGKARCDPDDSGLPYGYNAHPDVATGEQVGCLCRGVAEDEQEAGA